MIDALELAPTAPTTRVDVRRISGARLSDRAERDEVAVESPVALVFNGISHAVMMATPCDLEAFALGFALSEGLLASKAECHGIELVALDGGAFEVQLAVAASAEMRLKERRRTLAGRTGCGLCGIDSLSQLDLSAGPLRPQAWVRTLEPDTVLRAIEQLASLQPMNALTGAHHAAGWAGPSGELTLVMEDVGRHNALDKLLGQRLLDGHTHDSGFVAMTSRLSYELVRKCARMEVPVLAAISAPTQLAIDIAAQAGMTLYGFCRDRRAVMYAGPHLKPNLK
ncbi:MAG: formate dehydrogenase accessory sulfurtransferase FdhD [Burkholderiales bacterium]